MAFVKFIFLLAALLLPIGSAYSEGKLVFDGISAEKCWLSPNSKMDNGLLKFTAGPEKYFQPVMSTLAGIENGKEYIVEFKVKVLGDFDKNKRFEFVVRPDPYAPLSDIAVTTLYGGDREFQNVSLRFNVPVDGRKYCMMFWASGGASIEIRDLKLYEGNFTRFYPAARDAKPFEGKIENMPSGSEDFEIDAPRPGKGIVVEASDFGVSPDSDDNSAALAKAVKHCKDIGASRLNVKKGTYRFFDEAEILFHEMSDFTFDGGGSTFIFRRKKIMPNFHIVDCTRCEFRNFNMDWDWKNDPLAAIVKIEKVEDTPSGSVIDVRFTEFKHYPLYGKATRVAHMSPYDIQANSVGIENGLEAGFGYGSMEKGPKTEWLEPNLLRIHCGYKFFPPLGQHYRLQHFYYDADGFAFWSNTHLTLENINVYSCRGAAFYVRGYQHHWQMKNVNIKVPHIYRRPMTCTADHLFFLSSGGYFKLLGCEFSRGGDDCLNIHDPCSYGKKIDKRKIRIHNFGNGGFYNVGSKIEFRDSAFAPLNFIGTVKSRNIVDRANNVGDIEFEEDLPDQKTDGFVLFNRAFRSQNVIVRDCYFHSNRARGLLILTNDVTIENCKFRRNEMGAMKFETGYTLNIWCEGQGVDNVVVRNCSFDSSNPFGMPNNGYERDIFMGVYLKRDPSTAQTNYPILKNILFENNRFKDSYGLVAFIASSGNVIFKDNIFENPTSRKLNKPYRGQFYVFSSSNIKIVNNTYVSTPNVKSPGVLADESAKGIVVEGNRIVEPAENSVK